jgi:adhesin transport system outer membrane protein
VLASANRLIEALGVQMPADAYSDLRTRYKVRPVPASDRQENSLRYPVMGPPANPQDVGATPRPVTSGAATTAAPAETTPAAQ